ncbi:MAG: type IV toxin-antitoxin system AbiEi family antitoxin domain-containing protein [Protaetiibacter sp.]
MDLSDLSPLIITTSELRATGWTSSGIRRAVTGDRLIRLRRGSYCTASAWAALDASERHVLYASAVSREVDGAVLCGLSAAAAWRVPLIVPLPHEVLLLTPYRGGGTSEPGVRRTVVGARGAPVVERRGLRMTSLARTVVDIACSHGFRSGVVAMDWALARGLGRDELFVALDRRSSPRGSGAGYAAAEFADARSESPGESLARAAMFEAGFTVPELQRELVDDEGVMRVDFWWPDVRVAGEFDGRVKYGPELGGSEPGDALWREKRREDRVRRQADGMVRLVWADLADRTRLAQLLQAAGVPRRRAFGPGNASSE